MQTNTSKKWVVPISLVFIGFVYLTALWIGGEPRYGIGAVVFMIFVATILLFGGRSEVVRVLRGQPTDEMWKSFDVRASLFALFVLIVVMVGAAVLEMAQGQDAQPYAMLCFVGGVSYLAALLWFRWRS